jgi:hypothetical protein
MSAILRYPRGTTHIRDKGSMSEVYYRKNGETLEYFNMSRGEWTASCLDVDYLEAIETAAEATQ